MLAWVVNSHPKHLRRDRFHPRRHSLSSVFTPTRSGRLCVNPSGSLPPTPLFASSSLSILFPIPYSHTYTTATSQPLCNQSVTHAFLHNGGCTPLSLSWLALPPSNSQKPSFTVVDPFSFHTLTKCSSSNPFLLFLMQLDGGGVPSPSRIHSRDLPRSSVPASKRPALFLLLSRLASTEAA